MKITNRDIGIYGSLIVLGGTVAFLIINKLRNERVVKLVLAELGESGGDYGDIRDYTAWFSPNFYADVKAKNPGKNILLAQDARITDARTKIKNAWGLNDDEESVYAVFTGLKNGVEVSQVSASYQKNYGINLLDELIKRMSTGELKQIADILKTKKAFQYS